MADSSLEGSFEYLEALYRRPILSQPEAGLRRISYLLGRLDNPHTAYKSVHVTGTCGKGSTTTMIGSILQSSGYRTGLFRSPHLETYRERIAVDGASIDESAWLAAFDTVRPIADEMETGSNESYHLGRPSLFEFIWAMGALHFAKVGVDFAVVEVGVGGRLSPTNVLQPEVSVVTNVSLDHTNILGPTVEDIAREKSQVIKPGNSATTAATQPHVLEIIRQRTAVTGSELWIVGKDVSHKTRVHDLQGEAFDVRSPQRTHSDLTIGLLGQHQVLNAATAVSVMDLLTSRGFEVPGSAVRNGLAGTQFPGRFEIVSQDPLIILDGARNVASAAVLRDTLDDLFPGRSMTLVIGVLGDKDAFGIVDVLAPHARSAIVTAPPWEGRVGDLSRLENALRRHLEAVTFEPDPATALNSAIRDHTPGDLIVVTGSLYLVAAVRHLLKVEE